jgi:hypothetical protein
MLRVLQRSGHEGKLDSSTATACRVILQFGSFFKHLTLQRLRDILHGVFPHVVELPVAAVGGGVQVRGWGGTSRGQEATNQAASAGSLRSKTDCSVV